MFGRKKHHVVLYAPAGGRILTLAEVPDPVFAQGLVGPGFAVDPENGVFASPVAGRVSLISDTRHAFGITTPEGVEVLVHIGIDSVKLQGEGFRLRATVGDDVAVGDPVLEADLDVMRETLPSVITPVVITNTQGLELGEVNVAAPAGEPVLELG